MTLAPGSRLGPYEVVSAIGAGGMGEVWRARDTRLDRSVAIKVLSQELSRSAQFRLRFEREARTISQLNHPHICTLYDVGEDYLVMEYIEGESLADRLARGPLPIAEVLRYGAQIADALGRAHAAGIVHRDLKPGNVMLTRSGVKLLDFGLARTDAGPAVDRDAPTVQKPLTEEGTILGTFQYMAPEQLDGVEADARADIFALGCVLYEMATGRRAFDGKTRTSLIAAIVATEPPPISQSAPLTPAPFEHVVRRCLMKDREERWQSARDVAAELRWIAEAKADELAAPRRDRRLLWFAGLPLLLLAAAASLVAWKGWRRPALPSYRLEVQGYGSDFHEADTVVLSRDGTKLAFMATVGDDSEIFLRDLDQFEVRKLPGTRHQMLLDWSPDGKSLLLWSTTQVSRYDIATASLQKICTSGRAAGASWGDGVILIGREEGPLLQVPEGGGNPVAVTTLDPALHERGHIAPLFLPDGKHFLFLNYVRDPENPDALHTLYAGEVGKKEVKSLGPMTSLVQYGDGWLFFVRERALLAQRFDPGKLKFSGDPELVADGLQYFLPNGNTSLSVSRDGTVAWSPYAKADSIEEVDAVGKVLRIVRGPDRIPDFTLSRDGRRIVAAVKDAKIGTTDVWEYGLDRGTATRLTTSASDEDTPVLSPDGTRLYLSSDRLALPDLYERLLDGSGVERRLLDLADVQRPLDVSPDGRYLLFGDTSHRATRRSDLSVLSLADGKVVPFMATEALEFTGRFSRDGRWITFDSDASSRMEIYVKGWPSGGEPRQVSLEGGTQPRWSWDGKAIEYVGEDTKSLFRVAFDGATLGSPQLLFRSELSIAGFEPLPDGHTLLLVSDPILASPPIHLAVRWTATK